MAVQLINLQDTPEEIEQKNRQARAQRFRKLAIILVICVGARFLIKNPEQPKTPERRYDKVRYVPGMLDNLPKSAIDKMDPKLVAQIRKAETDARIERLMGRGEFKGTYKAPDAPLPNTTGEEEQRQMQFAFAKRRNVNVHLKEMEEQADVRKTTLVRFKSGGIIRAEKAVAQTPGYEISVDRSMVARLPRQMVASVMENALDWKEPVPAGFVQLKPVKGITITISKETAKRITIQKSLYNEI